MGLQTLFGFPLLALALPGCFGSCGGCSDEGIGGRLFDKLQAVDEASGGALSAPEEKREADEGARAGARPDWFADARLAGLTSEMVNKRFEAAGYTRISCSEAAAEGPMTTVFLCRYGRGAEVVEAELAVYRERDLFLDEIEGLAFALGVQVVAGGRIFSLRVADRKEAQDLLRRLFTEAAMPTARGAKAALERLGYRVHECLRSEEGGEVELQCDFEKPGGGRGGFGVERFDAPIDADPDQWQGKMEAGAARGRFEATVLLLDDGAARKLLVDLFPDLLRKEKQLLVLVSMEEEKHNGKSWDAGFGLPDPFIRVNGTSYREQRCRDRLDCSFVVPAADELNLAVFDADAAADDAAGRATCRPDASCKTRDAQVWITTLW